MEPKEPEESETNMDPEESETNMEPKEPEESETNMEPKEPEESETNMEPEESETNMKPENIGKSKFNKIQETVNTSKDPMIQKFIEFVNTYSKIDKIDDKVLEIVNTSFKTSSKFDLNNPSEKDLYIKESEMTDFCVKNINDNSMIPITINDPKLTEYIKIYKNMKNMYIENCEYLFRVIENKILSKTPVDEKDENPHFTIKNIGYGELVEIETDVRNKLVSMYSTCHEEYQKGIVALFKALNVESTSA